MVKKTKFMVGALVLSMGLLGTGYAYWTDALHVSTTVSTGELNVEWAMKGITDLYYGQQTDYVIEEELPEGTKSVTMAIGNMHPSARVSYYANAHNKGTIPVKVSNIEIIGQHEDTEQQVKVEDVLIFSGYYSLYPTGQAGEGIHIPIPTAIGLEAFNSQLDESLKQLNANNIPPGADIHFRVDAQLPSGTDKKYQNQKVQLVTTVDWTQSNDPAVIYPVK